MSNDKERSKKNNIDAVLRRLGTMDTDNHFYGAQPKITAKLAKRVNSRIVDQLKDNPFDVKAHTYADNLDCGLAIEFEHIMGFFMQMYKTGYNLEEDHLKEETLLHMAHWAHELVHLNFSLKEPYRPDTTSCYEGTYEENCQCIPSKVVVLLMFKAKTTLHDNSFF